jgi:hypothetical protein
VTRNTAHHHGAQSKTNERINKKHNTNTVLIQARAAPAHLYHCRVFGQEEKLRHAGAVHACFPH